MKFISITVSHFPLPKSIGTSGPLDQICCDLVQKCQIVQLDEDGEIMRLGQMRGRWMMFDFFLFEFEVMEATWT